MKIPGFAEDAEAVSLTPVPGTDFAARDGDAQRLGDLLRRDVVERRLLAIHDEAEPRLIVFDVPVDVDDAVGRFEDILDPACQLRSPLRVRSVNFCDERLEHGWTRRYLTGWRIQLAKYLILQAGLPIAEVADRVGYESEAAFNRAFKRHVGEPPAAWRKRSS